MQQRKDETREQFLERQREWNRAYRKRTLEHRREYERAHYKAHAEEMRAKRRKYPQRITEKRRDWLRKHSEELKEYHRDYDRQWRPTHRENQMIARKKSATKLRFTVLQHYGLQCACCGESHYEFLAIDHINGNGRQHRKSIDKGLSSGQFYRWLIKNNFPKEFQTLCHNCNLAKGFYGQCPHQRERGEKPNPVSLPASQAHAEPSVHPICLPGFDGLA